MSGSSFILLGAGSEGIGFAFEHSTVEGKCILVILFLASIFCWSVTITKALQVYRARKQNARFLYLFRKAKSPLHLYENRINPSDSTIAAIYLQGSRELTYHLLGSSDVDETFNARLAAADSINDREMAAVRSAMERAVGEEMLKLESNLILLATAVSGSPFLGLLGTVWGVMDAFAGIAMAGHADLAAMAPGVSGALITTVLALCVAIPAMFGYNFLVTTTRNMTIEMENFSAECAAVFEHRYVRSSRS